MADNFYKIKVNDDYEYNYTPRIVKELDMVADKTGEYHIINKTKTYRVKILQRDFPNKKYFIYVNSHLYSIQIEDSLDQLIKDLGLTLDSERQDSNIKAPMPGLILEIQVKENQQVKKGDALLILEAMKMENILLAPKDGCIKSLHIKKGNSVDKGQLLIEIE